MSTLVVNTFNDVVANDGKLSLREAIDRAGAGDVITFKPSDDGLVILDRSIVIENGKSVTIDGGGDVRISAIQSAIVVEDGAALTLRDINLSGGVNGAFSPGGGTPGDDGEHGAQGQGAQTSGESGTKGGDGEDGGGGGNAGDAGDAEGFLQNFGEVTLDHVQIHGTGNGGGAAPGGGGGGRGGWGGLGGYGLGGGDGGDGGDAGDGGQGGDGADGGDAIGSIYNAGELTLIDSIISGRAQGRDGGVGVFGGDGGRGGYGGTAAGGDGGDGGDGGHGGDGGDGGDGGTAVSAILNEGEITVIGAALINGAIAEAGAGGLGGKGGLGGDRGLGGNQNGEGARGLDGKDGEDGADGEHGRDGDAFDVLNRGDIDGKLGFDAHFFEFGDDAGLPAGITVENKAGARTEFSATVSMVGDGFDEAAVHWRLAVDGLKAANFVGGKLPTGELTFAGDGSVTADIEFALKAGVKLPKDANFEIVLFEPSKGDFLGSGFTVSADIFRVTAGADKVGGTKGDDDLSGFGGSDTLTGGAGDDSLDGGAGADRLTGGAGADVFEFARKTDSVQASRDTIVGFSQNDGDAIDLLLDADETEGGVQDFTFRGEKAFTDPGQIRFEYNARHDVTRVEANLDGDKQAEFVLDIAGRIKLTADDFLI